MRRLVPHWLRPAGDNAMIAAQRAHRGGRIDPIADDYPRHGPDALAPAVCSRRQTAAKTEPPAECERVDPEQCREDRSRGCRRTEASRGWHGMRQSEVDQHQRRGDIARQRQQRGKDRLAVVDQHIAVGPAAGPAEPVPAAQRNAGQPAGLLAQGGFERGGKCSRVATSSCARPLCSRTSAPRPPSALTRMPSS